jgi:anthranilate synthase component 2
MILLLDNYDSFTYNLAQLLQLHAGECTVVRNDAIAVDDVRRLKPEGIVISPGPGRPETAGISVELIRALGEEIPILGVCLGHQAIGCAFGGSIVPAPSLVHGKTSMIHHDGDPLFSGIDNPFAATRYHSLVISADHLPAELLVTARTHEGVIMAVRHRRRPIHGIQFHPESFLTLAGGAIIQNWLRLIGGPL